MFDQTIDAQEPVELYEISYTGNYWYFTSADRDIEFDGRTYLARPISRDDIVPSNDVNGNQLAVTFPADVAFAEVFRVQPPSEVVLLKVLVTNFMEPGFVVAWQGRIVAIDWRFPYAQVTAENVFTSLSRPGVRRRYSTTCPYALYSQSCGVSREQFRERTDVLGHTGLTLYPRAAAGKEDNYYAGGYVTWENGAAGNVEKRMIRASRGSDGSIQLSAYPVGLTPGQVVDIYAGCAHTIDVCDSKFGNSENCGATPFIPRKNPFGGTAIY